MFDHIRHGRCRQSMAVDVLEDIGYCSDNMPVSLIPSFIQLFEKSRERFDQVAGGGCAAVTALRSCTRNWTMPEGGFSYRILFLDARNAILTNRHKESRRRHPLQTADMDLGTGPASGAAGAGTHSPPGGRFMIDTSALLPYRFPGLSGEFVCRWGRRGQHGHFHRLLWLQTRNARGSRTWCLMYAF